MTCGIYSITNRNTGEMYIGQSICIENRFKQHYYGQDNNKSAIDTAIRGIGKDNFDFEILLECSEKELDYHEIRLIEEYNTFYKGYNKTRGGDKFDNPTKFWSNAKKLERGLKYSKKKSKTGIFRVHQNIQGYWVYMYKENGKRKGISSKTLLDLKQRVLSKGLNWLIVDVKKAEESFNKDAQKQKGLKKSDSYTGYYNVKNYKGLYKYFYAEDGKRKSIQSKDIFLLKKRVIEKGLLWGIIDNEKVIFTNRESVLNNLKGDVE